MLKSSSRYFSTRMKISLSAFLAIFLCLNNIPIRCYTSSVVLIRTYFVMKYTLFFERFTYVHQNESLITNAILHIFNYNLLFLPVTHVTGRALAHFHLITGTDALSCFPLTVSSNFLCTWNDQWLKCLYFKTDCRFFYKYF